jgi:hypothetical protein
MSKPLRKADQKLPDQLEAKERADFFRKLREEARGLPYDPEDDSLSAFATAGYSSTRH